jgi:hypothetical protein
MLDLQDPARRVLLRHLVLGSIGAATVPLWLEQLTALALAHEGSHLHLGALKVLTEHQNHTVVALSELIIPETETPGARSARVNEFIDAVIADAEPYARTKFLRGLSWLDDLARRAHGVDFIALTFPQQVGLLTPLSDSAGCNDGAEFFSVMKALTITGYYTSRLGMRDEIGDDGTVFFDDYLGDDDPKYRLS